MRDMSEFEKRKFEAMLLAIHETMMEYTEKYNVGISIMALPIQGSDFCCIYLHDDDKEKLLSIDRPRDIRGCLDGEWTKKEREESA